MYLRFNLISFVENVCIAAAVMNMDVSLLLCLSSVTKGQQEETAGASTVAVSAEGEEEEQSSSPLPASPETGAAQTSSASGEAKSRSEQHPLARLSHRRRGKRAHADVCVCVSVNVCEWLRVLSLFGCIVPFYQNLKMEGQTINACWHTCVAKYVCMYCCWLQVCLNVGDGHLFSLLKEHSG